MKNKSIISKRLLRRTARTSLVLIFLVIIAGSVVRMTGSGMGCPDWPQCFGYLIPPTDEAQVLWQPNHAYEPGQMIVKDEAMWVAESSFTTSDTISWDNWSKYTKHDYAIFNVWHTWIEYINRLAGALSGIPVFLLVVFSFLRKPRDWRLILLSFSTMIMLGFEAVLGKLVVDGNLIPGQITLHMMGALLIVLLLVAILHRLREKDHSTSGVSKGFVALFWVVSLVQIILGTRVREAVDAVHDNFARSEWIVAVGNVFEIHRTAAWLVVALTVFLVWKEKKAGDLSSTTKMILALVIGEIALGIILTYFDVPAWSQPTHLFLAVLLFTASSIALLRSWVKSAVL